ncbi:MAG: acyltransferase family protein [Bacteroidota bacterium]
MLSSNKEFSVWQALKSRLKVFDVIRSGKRNPAVDVARALAILSVALAHFNKLLPYGELGVDLFFVISGLLIGGILVNQYESEKKISFPRFFAQRAFKILPSFYFFMLFGNALVWLMYNESAPEYLVPWSDLKRYMLFYFNYTGDGSPIFFHIWSLCVEEHFYLILPFVFITAQYLSSRRLLLAGILGMIAMGLIGKYLSYSFLASQETYAGTHNRIDALGYGVLISYLFKNHAEVFFRKWLKGVVFILGLILLGAAIFMDVTLQSAFYTKVVFNSLTHLSFFLLVASAYTTELKFVFPLRFMAYFSYNWYLWHYMFVKIVTDEFGNGLLGVSIFLILTFAVSVIFTILIEETFLKIRDRVMG